MPSSGSTRKKRPPTALDAAGRGLFLRHHGRSGREFGELAENEPFGFLVGFRDGRTVGLEAGHDCQIGIMFQVISPALGDGASTSPRSRAA